MIADIEKERFSKVDFAKRPDVVARIS